MTSHPPPHSFSTDRRAQRLAAALQLEATFRSARNAAELAFAAVNEMQRVVAYDTAALFWAGRPRPGLVAVSAVAEIDRNAPFAHALERLGADLCGQNASSLVRRTGPGSVAGRSGRGEGRACGGLAGRHAAPCALPPAAARRPWSGRLDPVSAKSLDRD